MKREHADIRWNSELQEWFCATCGRTSDHTKLEDARKEMEHFKCALPSVETAMSRKAVRMLDLRLVKWIGTVPAMGECTSCGRQFKGVMTEKPEDALESIRQQFIEHRCGPGGQGEFSVGADD
jgi:transposase-like protein